MDNLLGVILCGGESRRMGHDKGLLDTGHGPWAIRMGDKLAPLPVIYSINTRQWDNYSRVLQPHQLVTDSLFLPDTHGPLKGVLSIHEKFSGKDLLLVACDMQDLDETTIGEIMASYQRHRPQYNFFAYRDDQDGFFQPLCGIYTARGLAAVYNQAMRGDLPNASLQSLLKGGPTRSLPVTNAAAFRNYNFPGLMDDV